MEAAEEGVNRFLAQIPHNLVETRLHSALNSVEISGKPCAFRSTRRIPTGLEWQNPAESTRPYVRPTPFVQRRLQLEFFMFFLFQKKLLMCSETHIPRVSQKSGENKRIGNGWFLGKMKTNRQTFQEIPGQCLIPG